MTEQTWTDEDRQDLARAVDLLENPGFMIRLTNMAGVPVEGMIKRLPEGATDAIAKAGKVAIETALKAAVMTMNHGRPGRQSRDLLHKLMAAGSGALGGVVGLPGLAVELPISTTIMLRSIADIARSEGEDLTDAEAKLQCVQVFAMGGNRAGDDASESAYWLVRSGMAKVVSEAASHVAQRGLAAEGAPVMIKFITTVAARFNVALTEKAAAQLVPAIGAVGGATVNALFMDHFQDMARGHFVVRRLERKHGVEAVREAYDRELGAS